MHMICFCLKLQSKKINVVHIESRKSQRRNSEFEIAVDVQCDEKEMSDLISSLQKEVAAVKLADFDDGANLPNIPVVNESFG